MPRPGGWEGEWEVTHKKSAVRQKKAMHIEFKVEAEEAQIKMGENNTEKKSRKKELKQLQKQTKNNVLRHGA